MTSGALVDIVAAMKRFQRRALGQAVAGALLATACGQVRFGGPGMGGPRPNTNMTAEDREKARKNLMRIMGEVYRPELEAGRKKLLEALAVTSGERAEQGASAGAGTPATTRIKRLKAPPRAVRVVPAMGGRIYTLEGAPTEASELAAQLKVASETNHMLEELARKRHLDVVLGVVGCARASTACSIPSSRWPSATPTGRTWSSTREGLRRHRPLARPPSRPSRGPLATRR